MIYLDNAATSLIKPPSVAYEMLRAMGVAASPGRGGHKPAMKAAQIVYSCREKAADFFKVSEPEKIIFTMNATHALNIAIHSLAKPGMNVLISGYEHNSVSRPLYALGANVIVAESPLFDREAALKAFEEKIETAELVVCTHVSNAFGFILPVYEIVRLCREKNVPIIVDASQSAGILEIDAQKLGADFIAMPGHKALFGPQGTGILICKNFGLPLLSGGSGADSIKQYMPEYLPDRHEAGTHNVTGIAGLAAGLAYVEKMGVDNIYRHEQMLMEELVSGIEKIPGLHLFKGDNNTQSGVLSFYSENTGCEELASLLAEKDVCVRSGLHCAPLAHRSAGTIERGTVRLSVSPFVSLENARDFCVILRNLL